MAERQVIADTGPLVAFLLEREPRHAWAVAQFKMFAAPFLTCEPVLTEAFHLLSRTADGPRRLFELLSRQVIVVDFVLLDHAKALDRLMHKYRDQPMSLADACLVRMAEANPRSIVMTLDRHFTVYRKHGRQPISVAMPGE